MEHLYDKLKEYGRSEAYPLHMPGHKRHTFGQLPEDVIRMDITEIDGFDDLHVPEGILLELQHKAAALYGAQESFYLVGGSTSGILSAVSAAVPLGGHLLMARNCHKSAYHAAYLRRLNISYLFPPILEEYGICDAITPEQVREALENGKDIAAVLIVSPTYEGRISPVREIAEVVHEFGKILIVDEAHGAHLGLACGGSGSEETREQYTYYQSFENSCRAGADLVINSVHKTLPAMTQTALLHVCSERVDREILTRFLRIYQSSSPSYVLMASIDNALSMIGRDGRRLFGDFVMRQQELCDLLKKCRQLRFLMADPRGDTRADGVKKQDIGKLLIYAAEKRLTGRQIYDLLREDYGLQPEMAAGDFCLAMFTVGDTREGFERTAEALLDIDRRLSETPAPIDFLSVDAPVMEAVKAPGPEDALDFCSAWDQPWEEVSAESCVGRYSADFVNLYPPGIPILVPGERFTRETAEALRRYRQQGLRVQGLLGEDPGRVRVLK